MWRDARCRVIDAGVPEYPGFCRVVWHEHVGEMSDLDAADRDHLMAVVQATEAALRAVLRPVKMNLASLGNQVPHIHWHVIARFSDDAHFPDSIWSPRRRPGVVHDCDREALARELARRLAAAR